MCGQTKLDLIADLHDAAYRARRMADAARMLHDQRSPVREPEELRARVARHNAILELLQVVAEEADEVVRLGEAVGREIQLQQKAD